MQVVISIVGFLLFIGLIIFHEWGHYYAARHNGVKVEEFGLGLPPRAWGKRRKDGMLLSLNWLPLGGFVKLKGEHDSDKSKGSYGAASLGAKTKIMLAGVSMNLLAGLFFLTILAFIGLPKIIDNQFTVNSDTKIIRNDITAGYVEPGSPASKAGLVDHDIITKITPLSGCSGGCQNGGVVINSAKDLRQATTTFAGQQVRITAKHMNEQSQFTSKPVKLRSDAQVNASLKTDHPVGHLGVIPTELVVRRSTWSAPIVAVGFTKQLTVLTFKGLGTAVKGLGSTIAGLVTVNKEARQNGQTKATEQTGGPVAIVKVIWVSGTLGANFMLLIIAIISLTLAIMNVLPIPALDGGRLIVTYIYRGLRRPLTQAAEERIHGTGMAVLLVLFALITVVDVKRFIL